jgi:hypothetical protein
MSAQPRPFGLMAEFDAVEPFLEACEKIRDAGFKRWDAHAPYPVHGLNDAMGIKHTRLPLLVLGAGLTGGSVGMGLQWWMNSHNYPLVISGKPLFGIPANIPIVFELTILFAAITAFVGMLAMNNLPLWYHPVFTSERFKRATSDRFFIVIESRDPKFDEAKTTAMLTSVGGTSIERVEE